MMKAIDTYISEKLVLNKDNVKDYIKDIKSDDYLIDANNWNVNSIIYCYDNNGPHEIYFYIIKKIDKEKLKNISTLEEIYVKPIGYKVVNDKYVIPDVNHVENQAIKFVVMQSGDKAVLRIMGDLMRLYDEQELTRYKEL